MSFLYKVTKFSSLFLAIAVSIAFGFVLQTVFAQWQEPQLAPPAGNVPGVIWNSKISNLKQDASLNIGGAAQLGSENLALGGKENLIYGLTGIDNEGNFLLLQTKEGAGYKTRVEIDSQGNLSTDGKIIALRGVQAIQGDIWSDQNINAGGCFGAVFIGLTEGEYQGNLKQTKGELIRGDWQGYRRANDICSRALGGGHVCSTAEIMESIKCARPNAAIRDARLNGKVGWISNGPPAFTANANDCQGWTVAGQDSYGTYWAFDADSGGQGWLSPCDWAKSFACCQ